MAFQQRKVRVKNSRKVEIDGIKFHSISEGYYYELLKNQVELGEIQSFEMQNTYLLQPQFKKCSLQCGFLWIRPGKGDVNLHRYQNTMTCPRCDAILTLEREIKYVGDFEVVDAEGIVHVIDVKSSPHFQTEIFKMKRKIFELQYPAKTIEMVFPKVPKEWIKRMEEKGCITK